MPINYPIPHLPMLGKGSVLLDVFDADGKPTGFQHLGNLTTVDQEIKDDRAELFQHINATPKMIANALKKRVVSLKLTGTDCSADHLAIAFLAEGKTTLTITADAVAAEVLAAATVTKKGKYFATAKRNLDATTIVVSQGGALTLNTDYKIADALEGIIYFPLDSGIDDAVAVTIDYTPIASSFDQVAGAVRPILKGSIRFAPDPTDGVKVGVEWWKCNLSPTGKFELVKDDYGNWELEVMVLDDSENHPDAPYFLATFYGVAEQ